MGRSFFIAKYRLEGKPIAVSAVVNRLPYVLSFLSMVYLVIASNLEIFPMSDRGGYRVGAGRKKLLSQKTLLVRTFHLSQSVYTQYKDLKSSGHFSSDDDFLGHLLWAEAASR